jgi:hypothetical protein
MDLVNIENVEDCFDGSFVKNFIFKDEINESMVITMGEGRKLNLFKDFPKPFYQIIDINFQIKGALGNKYFQIILYSKDKKSEEEFIEKLKIIK